MGKIKRSLFKDFPLKETEKRGKYTLYVQACTKIVERKKTLFLQFTHNGDSIRFILNNEECQTEHEGKYSFKVPVDNEWFYGRWNYNYWRPGGYIKKVVYLEGKDAFLNFGKHKYKEETGVEQCRHVLNAYCNRINVYKKTQREKQKEEKQKQFRKEYMPEDLPKLPRLKVQKYLPNYFIVSKEDKTKGFCTFCEKTKMPETIKHNAMVKCPSCGKEVKVIRRSIKKIMAPEHAWVVYPDEKRMILRYIFVSRDYNTVTDKPSYCQRELARAIMPESLSVAGFSDIIYFENLSSEGYSYIPDVKNNCPLKWYMTDKCYFSDLVRGPFYYVTNKYFNGKAIPYKDMAPFFKKMYPYFPDNMTEAGYYWIRIAYDCMSGNGGWYEKLLKTGYIEKTKDFTFRYSSIYTDPKTNATLEQLLGVDRRTRKLLGYNPSIAKLDFAKSVIARNISLDGPIAKKLWETFNCWPRESSFMLENTIAKCNYIQKQIKEFGWRNTPFLSAGEDFLNEYINYLSMSAKVGYDLKSKSVLYPRNFRKTEKIVIKEYAEIQRKAREKEERRQKRLRAKYKKQQEAKERARALQEAKGFAETIEKLKQAMFESKEIQKFMKEGNGKLLVKVPETPEELFQEHLALENCLNNYIGDMARGECLIFFIRKVGTPDKAYYAMEYKHGMITQIRGKLNCDAPPEVLRFGKNILKMIQKSPIIQQMPCAAA